jgi:PMC2NT (NUC016) domain
MSETIDQVLLPEQAAADSESPVDQDEFVRGWFKSLLVATRASNSLPGPDDFAFQSTYAEFVKGSGKTKAQTVDILHTLLDHVLGGDNTLDLSAKDSATDPAAYQALSDVIDGLLEEVCSVHTLSTK